MNAASVIGRVGGLAVAFGVGTAVLGGNAVASAKPAADGSDTRASVSQASETSGAADTSEPTTAADTDTRDSDIPADDAPDSDDDAADPDGAAEPDREDADGDIGLPAANEDAGDAESDDRPATSSRKPDTSDGDASTQVTSPASATSPTSDDDAPAETPDDAGAAAPATSPGRQEQAITWLSSPAAVAGRTGAAPTPAVTASASVASPLLTLVENLFSPFAGYSPDGLPSGSPLSWAMAAAARREALVAGGPISVDPTLDFLDGVIYGSVGATDTNGRPLIYTLLDGPDQGGKITLNDDGTFSFLPDLSVVDSRGVENFTVMVSQTSVLMALLEQIPIIGDFVQPLVIGLQQVPVLGALLQPIIGYRVITTIGVDVDELVPVGAPVAFTTMVTSFDGTQISTNFFPASGLQFGETAPTVLNGPGLGSAGDIDPTSETTVFDLVPGLVPLRDGGYNVVTWDPRGEFASGGILQLDNPFFEGRDVQAIISWVAGRPETELDAPGDPTMGMVGGSYGGGIQLVTAGIDDRVDAIVPVIAWNSLTRALYPTKAFKTGWATLLGLDLLEAGARINSQIYPAIILGDLLGFITETQEAILESSGPTVLVSSITAPTLLIQGTADGLFTLAQAVANAMLLDANGVPVEMIWACGGHGVCLDPLNPIQTPLLVNTTLDWLDRYVRGNELIPTGPRFEWFDQTGAYHSSDLLPTEPHFYGDPIVTDSDGGFLPIIPILGGSGPQTQSPTPLIVSPALASEASLALNLEIAAPAGTQIVGAPEITLTYSGLGTATHIYGQLVDDATGLVLGNLVTPIPVTLNGRTQTVTIDLEQIAYTAVPGGTLTLQLAGFATPYLDLFQVGFIDVESVSLSLPTVAVGAGAGAAQAGVAVGSAAA